MSSQSVAIEPACPRDLLELATIHSLSFAEDVNLYGTGPPGFKSLRWHAHALREAEYFKILVDQRIAGGIVVIRVTVRHCYLLRMFLHPEFQNRGVGTRAFELVEARFPNAEKWSLDTPYRSFRNHHFYRKLGFARTGTTVPEGFDLSLDPDFHLFVFEKQRPASD